MSAFRTDMLCVKCVAVIIVLLCIWLVCLLIGSRFHCPAKDSNGHWSVDDKEGPRCILRCNDGYQPSGCHVLRRQNDAWNHEIPVCKIASLVNGKTMLFTVGAGAAAVAAAPAALAAAGFTTTGITAGSLAAFIQAHLAAAGGWFAAAQSAGAAGIAATTKACIGTVASSATYLANSFFSGCEAE